MPKYWRVTWSKVGTRSRGKDRLTAEAPHKSSDSSPAPNARDRQKDMATSAAPQSGMGKLVKADTIAAKFRTEIEQAISGSSARARKPRLLGILSTSSAPSRSYAQFTKKTCEAIGIDFVLKEVGGAVEGGVDGEGAEEAIIEANEDRNIEGIMVYYPIFGGSQDHYLQQVVSPFKDVEGLHVKFHYNLYHNIRFIRPQTLVGLPSSANSPTAPAPAAEAPEGYVKSIIPCTPLAIVKALEHVGVYNSILDYGDRAYGRTVTIINRSEVVGRPLAALLANDGARVFSIDIDSIQEYTKRPATNTSSGEKPNRYNPRHVVHPCSLSLEQCLGLSDVVVSAVPSATYKVPTGWLKDGCICVNVASEKNFQSDVREKASLYMPAVGKITQMMLLRNLLRLCQYRELLESTAA
ncbi:Tetrahydrofolate dehydrogenase/cyclohydrolase, catalytic domain [Rhizoctonia solani]|uniref:Tetrahydrofolate dehydrogenase/cyclohydrolase, catalytic domain n=1 Tax=Rhizoctonia solani TaxID=456999 RepID=A0A8H7HD75_9AGAM|nr:Tetrahydrofolate dehydrogenase/cyclohydrolase, catalytic domain [Rhizoctonia solani]